MSHAPSAQQRRQKAEAAQRGSVTVKPSPWTRRAVRAAPKHSEGPGAPQLHMAMSEGRGEMVLRLNQCSTGPPKVSMEPEGQFASSEAQKKT